MEEQTSKYLCPYCGTKFEAFEDLKNHVLGGTHAGNLRRCRRG